LDHLDEIENVGPLRHHPADHDEIGPVDIGVLQLFGVAIDEAAIPRRRQHGRDRDETERRGHRLAAIDFTDRFETEEGPAGKSRRNQQDSGRIGHVMAHPVAVRSMRVHQASANRDTARSLNAQTVFPRPHRRDRASTA
jgi:hypothetical protein